MTNEQPMTQDLSAIRAAATQSPAVAAIDSRLAALGLARPWPGRGPFQGRRTRSGSRVVRSERERHRRPRVWRAGTSGVESRELRRVLALHGERWLWDADPALALALDLEHPVELPPLSLGSGCGCGGCG
jgi:hypothetical protein